jgi:hypothetical protein
MYGNILSMCLSSVIMSDCSVVVTQYTSTPQFVSELTTAFSQASVCQMAWFFSPVMKQEFHFPNLHLMQIKFSPDRLKTPDSHRYHSNGV